MHSTKSDSRLVFVVPDCEQDLLCIQSVVEAVMKAGLKGFRFVDAEQTRK